jgi:single-stranded-DNA-specific exonuclease
VTAPRWILAEPENPEAGCRIAEALELPPFLGSLLSRRGHDTTESADRFLNPRLQHLSDPFALPNMAAAVDRILVALDARERIVLYGDYDVDGVASLALLTRMLRAYGADPRTFLPLRADEGYGLSAEGLERCVETLEPKLLIAIDCGTTSVAEISGLQETGVDVLVFDHHECTDDALPPCPVVNPKLGADFHYLCSGGVLFKLCHALLKRRPLPDFDLRNTLDLVALATVADLVPLEGENRLLVQKGLEVLGRTQWPGVQALMEVAAVRAPVRPVDVGFRLGPRLNAAGRLGTAETALELLLTPDAARARSLAAQLDAQNADRQAVERQTCADAEAQLDAVFDPARDVAIVVGAAGWHPGVIGIVASRLSRTHHRPAIVVSFDENGIGKGSGRSIRGLSLVESLGRCGEMLEKFGGHEMAAGLTVHERRFEEFRQAFLACARDRLDDEALRPRLHLDCEISLSALDFRMLRYHEMLQPFGMGNHQPMFMARGLRAVGEPRVLKSKHLRMTLRQDGSTSHDAIFFNGATTPLPSPPWDVAFRIDRNEFRGKVSLQIEVQAIRTAV